MSEHLLYESVVLSAPAHLTAQLPDQVERTFRPCHPMTYLAWHILAKELVEPDLT